MKRIILITAAVFIASTGVIKAQTATPVINSRQVKQQERIEEGVENKQLTKKETARLEREQRKIRAEKRVAKADGNVSPREKRILKRDQNRASRDIYREKHDLK